MTSGYKGDVRRMTTGFGFSKKPAYEKPVYYEDEEEEIRTSPTYNTYFPESRNRTPHIQSPEEKFIIKAGFFLMLLYLFYLLVIKPIVVWVQSQLIPFILTTWQNVIHFIQSIQFYLIVIIFFIMFARFTMFFEKSGAVRPWSLLGGALASAGILLITIAVIGGI